MNLHSDLHADLQSLLAVWELDLVIDAARAQAQKLAADVVSRRAVVQHAQAEVTRLDQHRSALAEGARELQARIASYVVRRDRAQRSIDMGTATDFGAVTRQLAQCAEIVDEAELSLLENMEAVEVAEASQATAAEALELAQASLAKATALQQEQHPVLSARVKEVHPRREVAFLEVNPAHKGPYRTLRAKRRPALAPMVGDTCSACHVSSSAQKAIEARLGKRVHSCPGCGAFLLPEVPSEEAEG